MISHAPRRYVASFGPTCGDGALAPHEQCDDGNTLSGDGCSAECLIEARSRSGSFVGFRSCAQLCAATRACTPGQLGNSLPVFLGGFGCGPEVCVAGVL
jgi:cysteine-rich repeat protein